MLNMLSWSAGLRPDQLFQATVIGSLACVARGHSCGTLPGLVAQAECVHGYSRRADSGSSLPSIAACNHALMAAVWSGNQQRCVYPGTRMALNASCQLCILHLSKMQVKSM